jgi:two-component system OmpR family sensor kinase
MVDESHPRDQTELKARFLSTASHDLRTPLTTIKGSSDMLTRDVGGATLAIMKDMLDRGVDRVERIMRDLLYVVRADLDGGPPVHLEMVDLSKLLRQRYAILMREHPDADLDIGPGNYLVYADSEQLRQVVDHLLENADKFCSEASVEVSLRRAGEFAEVAVKDRGPGIEAADRERIFERFVRIDRPLTRYTPGAGVGLYVVKRAVEAMDGTVELETEPGEGATFTIKIPMVPITPAVGSDGYV